MGCGNPQDGAHEPTRSRAERIRRANAARNARHQAKVIFVLGGPGAGKGTQCQKLVETGQWEHLSISYLLREELKSRSKEAEMIENSQKEGKSFPSELLVGLVRKAMQAKGWSQKRFLIDGFPRNEENVRVWDQKMPDVEVLFLLFIRCSEDVMVQRILDRSQGQSDEKPESLKMKVRAFEAEIRPVLEIFRRKGERVDEIDGDGSIEYVFSQIIVRLPS